MVRATGGDTKPLALTSRQRMKTTRESIRGRAVLAIELMGRDLYCDLDCDLYYDRTVCNDDWSGLGRLAKGIDRFRL